MGSALLVGALLVSSCTRDSSGQNREQALEAVRAATQKYKDVNAALADGYLRDTLDLCETSDTMGVSENLGGMGIHYIRPDLLGVEEQHTRIDVTGTHTDFRRPAVLLYEPQPDRSLQLVAVENLVSADAWAKAGNDKPPSFEGVPFEYRPDLPSQMTKAQYDLHIWLFRENPRGTFAPYNPNVTCKHHEFNMPMYHPPPDPNAPEDHSKH
jgi:hypothetical protein